MNMEEKLTFAAMHQRTQEQEKDPRDKSEGVIERRPKGR